MNIDITYIPTLQTNDIFLSPGCNFRYRVVGAVCLLYDRENLPYPCCSLSWRGKQPSWNRRGRRFIPDISANNCETYHVELLGDDDKSYPYQKEMKFFSFTYRKLDNVKSRWWNSKIPKKKTTNLV